MSKRVGTHIRILPEVKKTLREISLECSAIEKRTVSMQEITRRTVNIPIWKNILIEDSKLKAGKNNGK